MRFLLIILLLFILIPSGTGQVYIPTLTDRATWTIEIGEGMGSFRYVEYTLDCDSVLINGKYYQELLFEDPNTDCEKESPSFVREDTLSRQLFYYNSTLYGGEEVLLADYTLVTFPVFDDEEERKLVVDSVFTFPFWGEDRNFWRFQDQAYGYFEGVGNVWGGILPGCNPNRYAVLYDREDGTVDCSEAVSVQDIAHLQAVSIYPNPASAFVTIDWEGDIIGKLDYQLLDLRGQLMEQGTISAESMRIELSALPVGAYLLRISQDGQLLSQHRIIHQP